MAGGGGIRTYRDRPVFDDRGATGTEYLGMVVVSAAIVLAVSATGVGQLIYDRIAAQICRVAA